MVVAKLRWSFSFSHRSHLFQTDDSRREGVAARLSALLMHLVGIRPEQSEIGGVPERVLPRLRRPPGIQTVHGLHVRFEKASEALSRALSVVQVCTLRRDV